jgi:hypothetical protein
MPMVQENPTLEAYNSNSTDHYGMTKGQINPIVISNIDAKSSKSKKSITKIKIQENTS